MVPPAASRLAAFAAASVATAGLADLVSRHSAVVRNDVRVRDWVQAHPVSWLLQVARVVVDVLSPPVDIGVTVVVAVLVARRCRDARVLRSAAVLLLVLVGCVLSLKYGIDRHGPGRYPPGADPGGYFPSGHTTSVVVCGACLGWLLRWTPRRTIAVVSVATVVVGAALVYVSGHWLSDVVGAVPVAAAILAVAHPARPRHHRPRGALVT